MRRHLAGLAATAALAGCGGGNDFAEEATAVCERKGAEVEKLPPPRALILFEDYLEKALPILRAQHSEVRSLDGADSDGAADMIKGWEAVLAALEDMQKGAKAGSDIEIVIPLRRAAAAEKLADEAARAAGADACVGFNPITPA